MRGRQEQVVEQAALAYDESHWFSSRVGWVRPGSRHAQPLGDAKAKGLLEHLVATAVGLIAPGQLARDDDLPAGLLRVDADESEPFEELRLVRQAEDLAVGELKIDLTEADIEGEFCL